MTRIDELNAALAAANLGEAEAVAGSTERIDDFASGRTRQYVQGQDADQRRK